MKHVELNTKIVSVFLNTETLKMVKKMVMFILQQELKKNVDENLKKPFINVYIFSNHNIHKFMLLLQKGV